MSFFKEFSDFLTSNASMFLNFLLAITGIIVLVQSIKIIIKYNNDKKEFTRYNIEQLEIISNGCEIELYKREEFFRLKNKGKSPCDMKEEFDVDVFYLSPTSSMYLK